MQFGYGITVLETENGLLIAQDGRTYIARNWRRVPATIELIRSCLEAGFTCMMRNAHPLPRNQLPSSVEGVVHLSFSKTPDHRWSIAVDSLTADAGDYGFVGIKKKYGEQLTRSHIAYRPERRNPGNYEIDKEDFFRALPELSSFDHAVLERDG